MLFKIFKSVALAATLVSAQTFTECDPTKRDDCPNPKAVGAKVVDIDFRKGPSSFFKLADGTSLKYDANLGAVFSISNENEAPTIASTKYIFFGQVDVVVRASAGAGIVSSFVLQSDDLDEIDWEWLGGDNTQVQHNYFSKGCTENYDRGGTSGVGDPIGTFHTYTIRWTPEKLEWIIDGTVVRTLQNHAGLTGCDGYPQTPMQIKLGNWVAGRPGAPQGTIDWAGGLADFSKGPYEGYYQSIRIQDFMGGRGAKDATEYQWTDRSGTWESVKVVYNGEEVDQDDVTTTKKTSSTSTSTAKSSATVTSSFATVTKAVSTASFPTTPGSSFATFDPTSTESEATATETGEPPLATAAAPRAGVNMAAVAVAAVLGYLAL
ncbi:hypothetical protein VTJ49DRAFT_5603 [Mycothermus thermophilus]|uniref:Crh-like protein n=1 Tax=Humicola insolens TaxID=85995 RepID=A0ABR3V393_HUMIN